MTKFSTLHETCQQRSGDHFVVPGPKAVYRLSEPLIYSQDKPGASFVYVSAARIMGDPETYAFPCDEKGDVLSWSELDGSQKGTASHADVLSDMGYPLKTSELPGGTEKDGNG